MHIFFSDFLCFDMSLLLLTVALRGVSNKHCLLSFFFHFSLNYIGIKQAFPFINICKVPREVLKTEGEAEVFNLPEGPCEC